MSRPVRNSKFREPGHVFRLLSGGDPDYELDLPGKPTKKAQKKKNVQSEEEKAKAQQEKADLLAKIEEEQLAEECAAKAAFPRSLKGMVFDLGP